jgi:hypothetical protein
MWIFTTRGFYSIVKSDKPDHMLVRSRFRGDIEILFQDYPDVNVEVLVTPQRDYLYRAVVHRDTVQIAIANCIPDIDYPNFKDAVSDENRHPAYGEVWHTMYLAGDVRMRPSPTRYLTASESRNFRPVSKKKKAKR